MTKGRYVAPLPAQPSVELTPEQLEARRTYMQLGVASATLRMVYVQLEAHLPDDMLTQLRNIGGYVEDQMWTLDLLQGTMVTQGRDTLPVLKDRR